MKRSSLISAALLLLSAVACRKGQDEPVPGPDRDLSTPEKIEGEVLEVLSKDWLSLADTLHYFDSTMLSQGKMKGRGPDGVYYELSVDYNITLKVDAAFMVEDSTWLSVSGRLSPLSLTVTACETEIRVTGEQGDSLGVAVSNIKIIAPMNFLTASSGTESGSDGEYSGPTASLLYKGVRVGWLTREQFENTDYSTGTYTIIHYYNDPRTFALYDIGLERLLDMAGDLGGSLVDLGDLSDIIGGLGDLGDLSDIIGGLGDLSGILGGLGGKSLLTQQDAAR